MRVTFVGLPNGFRLLLRVILTIGKFNIIVPHFYSITRYLSRHKLKSLGQAVWQLVEVTSRKVAGSIPDDVIEFFF